MADDTVAANSLFPHQSAIGLSGGRADYSVAAGFAAAGSKARRGGYAGPQENAARLVLINNGIGPNCIEIALDGVARSEILSKLAIPQASINLRQ
jgi:hypothetical protein